MTTQRVGTVAVLSRATDVAVAWPRRVLVLALLIAGAAGVACVGVADRLDPFGFVDPSSEHRETDELVEEITHSQAGPSVIAMVDVGRATVDDTGSRAVVGEVERILWTDPDVRRVLSYYDTGDPAMVSTDRRATYVLAFLRPGEKETKRASERLADDLSDVDGVTLGGVGPASSQVVDQITEDITRAEVVALPLMFLLSLVFFRGLVAAALPPIIGGLGIVLTIAGISVANEVAPLSVFALNLVTVLGLGLAIDYSLFIVSRFREELAKTDTRADSVAVALRATMATAGRTVLYSGLTVGAALASLLVFPQPFLYSMGVGGVILSLVAVVVSLVVLPALLMLLGPKVNAFAPRWLQQAAKADARPRERGLWYRLAHIVMRQPGLIAVVTALGLLVVASPITDIRFDQARSDVLPAAASARQVDTVLDTRFAETHRTEPIRLVLSAPPGPELDAFLYQVRDVDGVANLEAPIPLDPDHTLVNAIPLGDYLSEDAQDTVRDIRDLAADKAPFDVGVAGFTAEFVDLKSSILVHLPWTLGILVLTLMGLIFLMTGSVVLPIKALAMNVLSISATLGILVWVFQGGRLEGLLDYRSTGALQITQPLLMGVLAFGLATDYGLFLLSRIKEARDAGLSDSESIAMGMERTGRIISAAAILFAVAAGAGITSEIGFMKQQALGLVLAVIIDATIIRALLVPALMQLLGRRNWWAPGPLARLHQRIGPIHS